MSTTIWVTGSSRGIGKAIACRLAKEYRKNQVPLRLVVNSRHDGAALDGTRADIEALGVPCLALTGDVGNEKDRERMVSEIHTRFGPVDILVNNAGISHIGLLQDMSPSDISRILRTDLESVIALSALLLPDLLQSSQSPRILNISSVWGNVGASCEAIYSAAKGGVNSFTKALAKELAPSRIPVNAIACGIIDTAMNASLSEEELARICEDIPAGRMGTPEEAAQLACLILQAPDYLTGQILTMDGGWT